MNSSNTGAVSLVLPYWQRQAVADAALASLTKHYSGLDLEIVVVDDGNEVAFVMPGSVPFRNQIVCLSRKDVPKCSGLPINRGVRLACSEHIAISGPDMMHTKPILVAMRDEIDARGPDTYVTAAAWFPDGNTWHAHSSIAGRMAEGVQMPANAHYHFMTMLHRDLFNKAGGFDEDYRDGAGYDDADWLLRLERVGAKFVMRDDLVVSHTRKNARSKWKPEQFDRNRQLFREKWLPSLASR